MVTRRNSHYSFEVRCPGVQRVYLVGEFNGWSKVATPMRQVRPGIWQVNVSLEPGTFRFRYFVPEQTRWITDFAAFGITANAIGGYDSVIHVPQPGDRLPAIEHFPAVESSRSAAAAV